MSRVIIPQPRLRYNDAGMISVDPAHAQPPFVVTLDLGTSSLRAMLLDAQARLLTDARIKIPYEMRTTPDGGVEADADEFCRRISNALDGLLARAGADLSAHIAGVATSSLASNLVGVDESKCAVTPLYTYADTRSAAEVIELASRVDVNSVYARTGTPMHTGYWPARLLWLQRTHPEEYARAAHWMTLHEYLLQRLFGHARCSLSMASWSGMLDQTRMDWDEEWLAVLPVRREQLSALGDAGDFLQGLRGEYARRWPPLREVPFFLAVGDGATSNLGCGATGRTQAALSIGTSGALRVVREGAVNVPRGLWLYRVDRRRGLLGGSLSEGGNLHAWLTTVLRLPDSASVEAELVAMEADAHGLTVLPFLAGERSPGYRADARAVIEGLSLNTRAIDLVRAGLEAIALRFALIHELLTDVEMTIANGGALLSSPAWMQIIADALGRPVIASGEEEASSRGAALLALESLGLLRSAEEQPAAQGRTFEPDAGRHAKYLRARERQMKLYRQVIGD